MRAFMGLGPHRSRHRPAIAMCVVAASAMVIVVIALARAAGDLAPIHYLFTFPEPEHRWMQVEVSFTDLGQTPIQLRMSRSSPGRYSLHDFAKNVYDVHTFGRDGRELPAARPDADAWTVS